ncbi:MAG TPA: thermonuclease family protein [Stellaceae bacterium]|nr:thermonuclease family protein [Stellaceae bacterium]
MQPLPSRPARLALALAVVAALFLLPGASTARAQTAASDAAPAADPAGDLPTIEVGQRPVHAVPEGDAAPARPVTIKGPDGRETALRAPPAPRHYTPSPPPLTHLSGAARVTDGVSLSVLGRKVRLFGVRAPAAGDLCAAGDSTAPRPCSDEARGALIARLAADDRISCQVPPGQRAPVPAAVCHDAGGTDLGGMLVADGFALADPTQSYDYFGAEAAARQLRRGLWHYR